MSALKQKNNIIAYKGEIRLMSEQAQNGQTSNGEESSSRHIHRGIKGFMDAVAGIWPVILSLVGAIIYIVSTLTSYGDQIIQLNNEVESINEDVENINSQITAISSLAKDNHEMFLNMSSMVKEEAAYTIQLKDIYEVKTEMIQNEEFLAAPLWDKDTVIASDVSGDIVYKAEDLYNTPIITSYMEGDNEVFFYGKFNKNNHWNGKCILNVYSGNNLLSIFEGTYNDGVLFSYKRVSAEGDTWVINDRVNQEKYNSGETCIYSKTTDFVKDFTVDNVKEKQIIPVENFLESRKEKLISYYKGNTSNGRYNDSTGNAFLVKYKEDGDVSILYEGQFKDGDFQDTTGNAWFICWGENNDGYYYYEGDFNNGDHGKAPKHWEPMTQEQIDEYAKPEKFKCPLTGLIDDSL